MLKTGGAEHHLLDLCSYLSRRGHVPSVCSLRKGGTLKPRFESSGVTVHELPIGSLRDLIRPRIRRRLREIVASARPDILHAHLYAAEAAGAVAAGMTGLPLVVTRHSSGLEFNGYRRIVAAATRRKIRRVIAVSDEAAAEAVRLGARPGSVVTIPNGVDTSRFRPADPDVRLSERERLLEEEFPGGRPDCFLAGYVGGLKPGKGLETLLEAFAALKSGTGGPGESARLLLVGEGISREKLERQVADLGLQGEVALPGLTQRPEQYLQLLDLFVLPSYSEGVPIALLEAMSTGLACAVTGVGGMPSTLSDCGVVFDPGDTDGLSSIMADLASDEAGRLEMGRRARVRALERFDLEIWGSRMTAVYDGLEEPA
jgi:glycosyltransferase involved in cell wall biosynthesis